MSNFFGSWLVLWIIIFIISFFTASEEIAFGSRILYTAIMAALGAAGLAFGDGDKPVTPRKSKSNMISCPKCGFLGVGYGFCPKCGSTIVNKVED